MKLYRSSIFAAALLCVLPLLHGCTTLRAAFADPEKSLAAQITVQYATGKFIEAGKTPAAQLKRAEEVKKAAESLKAATADEGATLATLRVMALEKVKGAGLAPADQLLANTLVDVAATALTERIKRQVVDPASGEVITVGVFNPTDRLAVHKLLDWVISAASVYG